MAEALSITLGGTPLQLLADRAILHQPSGTLLIADLHLGKSATFRAAGLPVPEASHDHDLHRLTTLVRTTAAQSLIVLGDLVHSRCWDNPATRSAFVHWRAAHTQLDVSCICGNHDLRSGQLPDDWLVRSLGETATLGNLSLVHDPALAHDATPTLAGHLHPGVNLRAGRGRSARALRGPCFWQRNLCLTLPAFGGFTGLCMIDPQPGDGVWILGPGAILDVASLAVSSQHRVRT